MAQENTQISIRNVPAELVRQAKAKAAGSGLSFKDFVIVAIKTALRQDPIALLESELRAHLHSSSSAKGSI